MRYVTIRTNRSGKRYYWQRKGFKLTRLSDDPRVRYSQQLQLNNMADNRQQQTLVTEGTFAWVVQKYKETEGFIKLAPGTKRYYNQFLDLILESRSEIPFEVFGRKEVVDFIETFDKTAKRKVAAVLRNLFNTANYHGIGEANHARDLRLEGQRKRSQIWKQDQCSAWLEASEKHPKGQAMAVAFHLLAHTVQRPGDVLKMARTNYNGKTIKLRQQKTGKQMEIPCAPVLRRVLDTEIKATTSLMLVSHEGRPLHYIRFHEAFNEIRGSAGLPDDLQPRDLRRTAMVNLALNGATDIEIAALSGHTIEQTKQILETYIPRNLAMAENAIARLGNKESLTR